MFTHHFNYYLCQGIPKITFVDVVKKNMLIEEVIEVMILNRIE
jgi:hypothetical protein